MMENMTTDTKIDSILAMLEGMVAKTSTREDFYMNIDKVVMFTGISKATIYEKMKLDEFPRPHKFGKSSRWLLSEIVSYGKANRA